MATEPHWNWGGKSGLIRQRRRPDDYRLFGLRVDAQWQGAMLTLKNEKVARLEAAFGQPLIYVDFIEVVPWNWNVPATGQHRRYGRIGLVLLQFAVQQSKAENCAGRIGLHALEQAEGFYTAIGMTSLGSDEAKEEMPYFELTEAAANEFLNRR